MTTRPRQARLRRARRSGLLTLSLLLTTACGLQQAGLDGAVTVAQEPGQATPGGTSGGLPAGTTGGVVSGGTTGTTPGGSTGVQGGTTGMGTTGGLGPVGTTGSTGGTSTGSSTGVPLPQSPGLKGTIVASYVNVTGFDRLGQIVVINTASTGDARQQTTALANYVNSRGGIAGRKLVTKVHDYNAQQASEVNDNNLCQAITGTDKAFMAVLHGQIHASARDCYAAKKTLAFEGAAYGFGKSFYDQRSPHLWSPSYADYDQSARSLAALIKAKKWLKGETKVGIVLWDDKPYHDIADKTLIPLLKQNGVSVVKGSVSNSDIGSIENGIHAAAQTMTLNQVDHLLFLGSAPLQPFFVQQNQQNRQFVYALSTFDVPRYMAVNFPNNMAGAIGIGFSPVDDVLDPQHKFPQAGLETTCRNIYKAAGIAIAGRYVDGVFNSKQAMSYCESTLLLKRVADAVQGDLNAGSWTAQAEKLGTSFQAAQTFSTSYGRGKHTGAVAYREITYTPSCECMVYTSGPKTLR
jgi:hypothetical protein